MILQADLYVLCGYTKYSTTYSKIMLWKMKQIFCVKKYYETKAFKIVLAKYKRKFNISTFPNWSQIFKNSTNPTLLICIQLLIDLRGTLPEKQRRAHKWWSPVDPSHGRAKAGRPARAYIQQLCEDTGCSSEDPPEAMNDREEGRERIRDIRAGGTTRWWWWWWYT